MRKIIALALSSVLALSMTACTSTPVNNNPNGDEIVKLNDKLYYNTSQEVHLLRMPGHDGSIELNVPSTEIPTENGQSNFEGYFIYTFADEHHVDLYANNGWYRFCDKECEESHDSPITEPEGENFEEFIPEDVPDMEESIDETDEETVIDETVEEEVINEAVEDESQDETESDEETKEGTVLPSGVILIDGVLEIGNGGY